MSEYNFWADLFDTYQSTADWIKALWIVSVPAFVLGLVALVLRYRLALAQGQDHASEASEIGMDDETVARFRRVLSNRRRLAGGDARTGNLPKLLAEDASGCD